MTRQRQWQLKFTRDELVELRRALHLIHGEDTACDVNMDAASVKAKKSALAKLNKATGWTDPFAGWVSVNIVDVVGGK